MLYFNKWMCGNYKATLAEASDIIYVLLLMCCKSYDKI